MNGREEKMFIEFRRKLKILLLILMMVLYNTNELQAVSAYEAMVTQIKYEKAYTIENILTDYQYFVRTDLSGSSGGHTVGPVVVGGTLNLDNTVGDFQLSPSYVNYIEYIKDFKDQKKLNRQDEVRILYHNGYNAARIPEYLQGRITLNPGYIDIAGAFEQIQKESTAWANTGTAGYELSNGVLRIKLQRHQDNFITIPYSIYSQAYLVEIEIV